MKYPPKPTDPAPGASVKVPCSPWAVFQHPPNTVNWIVSVVSNIGTRMCRASSGWLMTTLNAGPLMVSLVQSVSTLPMFLLALPAGALAEILDKCRSLVVGETSITLLSLWFALLVPLNHIDFVTLLLFAFFIAAGGAWLLRRGKRLCRSLSQRRSGSGAFRR